MLSSPVYNKTVTYLLFSGWLMAVVAMLRAEPIVAVLVGTGHSICGPWGCGPPLSSLLVWNGFIAFLLVPPAFIVAKSWPDVAGDWAGPLFMIVGLTVAIFMVTNVAMWWHSANEVARGYVIHRALFSLVAFTDAPMVPLTLSAGIFWWMARRHRRANAADSSGTNHDARAEAQQVEDFGDVTVRQMDTAS